MRHSFALSQLIDYWKIMGTLDSCYEHIVFGGKPAVIDGDSRQTFPTVLNTNEAGILNASLTNSQ